MVRRRRRDSSTGGGGPSSGGSPAWMMTYGDLVTQVLAFFVLMFTFSSLDVQKFRETVISLHGALGVMPGGSSVTRGPQPRPTPEEQDSPIPNQRQLKAVYSRIKTALEERGATDEVEIEYNEKTDRLIIRYRDQALFDSGKANLRPDALPRLAVVGEILAQLPNRVRVEGHTDTVPIRTPTFPSNWELSSHRAMAVVRLFESEFGLDPRRLEGAGQGEWYPVAGNDSVEGRARNRRVDIIVLSLEDET